MLALIAGTGGLPRVLAERARAAGDPPVVCALEAFPPDVPTDLPRLDFRLETFGTLLATLVEAGVDRLCMAGAVRRVPVEPARVDARTAPLMPRLAAALARGDDGTLREIIAIIEETGITVIGAEDIAPDLLPPPGIPTRAAPPEDAEAWARAGEAALAEMGAADLGQAVVLRDGCVLGREDEDGTAALIARFAPPAGTGAVLYKAPKPGQERRADLPLIGPDTASACAAAGFAGLIVEAGGVMVLDLDRVVGICDEAGLFLWIRPRRGEA